MDENDKMITDIQNLIKFYEGLGESNPQLKVLQQQKEIANATTQVEIAKKLPDLTVAFSNGSIQGIGADDIYYKKSNRKYDHN